MTPPPTRRFTWNRTPCHTVETSDFAPRARGLLPGWTRKIATPPRNPRPYSRWNRGSGKNNWNARRVAAHPGSLRERARVYCRYWSKRTSVRLPMQHSPRTVSVHRTPFVSLQGVCAEDMRVSIVSCRSCAFHTTLRPSAVSVRRTHTSPHGTVPVVAIVLVRWKHIYAVCARCQRPGSVHSERAGASSL